MGQGGGHRGLGSYYTIVMELIAQLTRLMETTDSPFQVQLAKEDLGRIATLRELSAGHDTLEDFQKAGLFIGWTKGDFRTKELEETLLPLMAAIFAYEKGGADSEKAILDAWRDFNAQRMKVLLHCL